jgi:hypothetical protein
MNWGTFLIALAGPIVKRALLALGIGWITYKGLDVLLQNVIGAIQQNFGAFSGQAAQIFWLSGFGTAVGIILGAIAARLSMMVLGRLGKVVS